MARALDSIFAQTSPPAEVVVVDDGSTDATREVLAAYAGRIKLVEQDHRGVSVARNAGVQAASGQYVAFLDADDIWLPDKLAKVTAEFSRDPARVLAYSDALLVDEDGGPQSGGYVPPDCARAPSKEDLLSRWWYILTSAVVMRRDTFLDCGGFDTEFRTPGYEDFDLWLRVRDRGEFEFVPERLVTYCMQPFLERMEKYAAGFQIFSRRMRERYGRAGRLAIRGQAAFHNELLNQRAVVAMAQGQLQEARRMLRCAMRYKRDRRTIMRLFRTHLPTPLALALTSRKRRLTAAPERLGPH